MKKHWQNTFVVFFLTLLSVCLMPRAAVKNPLDIKGEPSSTVAGPKNEKARIGIRIEVETTTIGSEDRFTITDAITEKSFDLPAGTYTFSAKDNEVVVEGKKRGMKLRLRSSSELTPLQSRSLNYRGEFLVVATDGNKLNVINELGIDDYLKGVLPREVVVSWHEESLRAQAVASRTYLASHFGSHAKQGFDLCSDVHCQVYGGMNKEHPRTNAAVDDTKSEILAYEGKPIGAFFHSNCGGTTEQIHHVWGNDNRPYLPRKRCSYGTADPKYNWKLSLTNAEILGPLKAKTKVRGSQLKSVKIKMRSPSQRAERILVTTDEGEYDLSGNEFRIAENPEKIRSTLFTKLQKHGDGYLFEGRGWGHGVGMCQWGAKGQAEQGKKYQEILSFYYPNSELVLWQR